MVSQKRVTTHVDIYYMHILYHSQAALVLSTCHTNDVKHSLST